MTFVIINSTIKSVNKFFKTKLFWPNQAMIALSKSNLI